MNLGTPCTRKEVAYRKRAEGFAIILPVASSPYRLLNCDVRVSNKRQTLVMPNFSSLRSAKHSGRASRTRCLGSLFCSTVLFYVIIVLLLHCHEGLKTCQFSLKLFHTCLNLFKSVFTCPNLSRTC